MYKQALLKTENSLEASKLTNKEIAQKCLIELDKVFATKPILDPKDKETIESWIYKSANFDKDPL